MATLPNTSRPATVTRLHVQQSVASGRRGTDGGLDRAGVSQGRAPDTLPRGSEPQFPPRMTDDGRDAPCGQWVGGALLSSRGFYWRGSCHGGCFLPMHVTVPLVHSATCRVPMRCGDRWAHTAGTLPPANETSRENGREAWAGPRPPCPHGSWGTNWRGVPEAERDSAGRRPRASLCHRTSSAGHSSVGEGEVPPREHRVRPEEGPGLATLVPLSPLGSGGRRPAWLGPSLG